MKTTKYFLMIAILLYSFTGCKNDDDGPNPPEPEYEGNVTVQLKLSDETPMTYAADDTEDPLNEEMTLAQELDVFVFDEATGKFEVHKKIGHTNNTTNQFLVTSGYKLFYVFSNFPGNLPSTSGISFQDFEKNIRETTFSNNNTSISEANKFFIGTLWGDTVLVKGSGTSSSPEIIKIPVGRIAAKIKLNAVPTNASGMLNGAFDSAYYRIRSIPKDFYIVGQHSGNWNNLPPGAGIQVESAVHNEGPNAALFFDYAFPDSTLVKPNAGSRNSDVKSFYAIENTTKADNQNQIYYGNTTYIQLKVKYEPETSEIYDGGTGLPGADIDDPEGSFYTGILNGSRLVFNTDPSGLGALDIVFYYKGLNYYNIPIKDMLEETISKQASVIRNHYYEVNIQSISRFGENTPHVPPDKPIEDDKDIKLEIEVIKWSKVTHNPEL